MRRPTSRLHGNTGVAQLRGCDLYAGKGAARRFTQRWTGSPPTSTVVYGVDFMAL
jgi:hypothetical protein